jgi:hypothetical protein
MRATHTVLALGFLAALGCRLAFFHAFSPNYDTQSYEEVVRVMASGGDPYGGTDRYNYSPIWAGVLRTLDAAARPLGISLAAAVGALLLLADAATALVLFRLAGRSDAAARAALLFFASPSRSGSRLPPVLRASRSSSSSRDRAARAGLATGRVSAALAASLLVKHVAAFHPLLFLRGKRPGLGRPPTGAGRALPGVIRPFWRSWRPIRDNVFLYGGLGGLYGMDALRLLPGVPFWVPRLIFAAPYDGGLPLRRAAVSPRARACSSSSWSSCSSRGSVASTSCGRSRSARSAAARVILSTP